MYIILKGRVVVEKKSKEYGNLPLVIALLKDGQHFGELSLINQEKVGEDPTDPDWQFDLNAERNKGKFALRKASCITAEDTDLLVLDHRHSLKLLQPDETGAAAEQDKFSSHSISSKPESATQTKDDLGQNIKFLKEIPILNKIDAQLLIPIACNILPKTYSFGDLIVKAGEVPPGLVIIVQG